MDEVEAGIILEQHIERYRGMTYSELRRLVKDEEHFEVNGASGVEYQVEAQASWDEGREGGNLRVMVSIDDGGLLQAIKPMTNDFIVAPDGSFVGE